MSTTEMALVKKLTRMLQLHHKELMDNQDDYPSHSLYWMTREVLNDPLLNALLDDTTLKG